MPLTIRSTPKAPDANSYCDMAFATDYFAARPNSAAWGSDVDEQTKGLLFGCRRLEQERYKGTRTTQTQALKFPRIGVTDDDGVVYDPDVNPREVMEAQCELTLKLMSGDITDGTGLEAFRSVKAGSVALELREPVASHSDVPNEYPASPGDPATSIAVNRWQLPFQVQRLLRNFLTTDIPDSARSGGGWGTVRLTKS